MKGFTCISSAEVKELALKGIQSIKEKRLAEVEKAILYQQTKPVKQKFSQWLFDVFPPNETTREQAIERTKDSGDGWYPSLYWYATHYNEEQMKSLTTLYQAACVSDGDILVDLEMSAVLNKIKEST